MKIPHSKPSVTESDVLSVATQTKSGMHAPGNTTKQFENKLKKITKTKYVFATQTGTASIHIALLALNIKPRDQVIIPSYICQSVLSAIKYSGATPILVDISPNSFNLSAKTIKPLVTPKTKAIIVPHMFGSPSAISEIKKLKIPIIEDCAHFLPPSNLKGNISTFSFYATKMITTGQGGAVATNNKILANRISDLLKYDKRQKLKTTYNYSLSNIQSSLGLSQLKKLSRFVKQRKAIASLYSRAFKDLPITLPQFPRNSIPFRYIILLKNTKQKTSLQKHLQKHGITAEEPIYRPLHQYLSLSKKNFPNTEKTHSTALSIPIYPSLKPFEVKHIIETIKKFFN